MAIAGGFDIHLEAELGPPERLIGYNGDNGAWLSVTADHARPGCGQAGPFAEMTPWRLEDL